MVTLFHGSDLHFGKAFDPEVADTLRRAVDDVTPDLVVLSGDFTQRAKAREYKAARAFLEGLPDVPLVLTPGNHDVPLYRVWERIGAPLRNYRRYISPELDAVTSVPGVTAVALNSTAPRRAIVNGRISDRQLLFAARAFQSAPQGDLKVVVAHHHLAPAPDFESDQILPGYQRCLDAFGKMGVDLILGGHLHRAYVANSLDVYPGGNRDHAMVIAHSGTTTSRRGRARERLRNSFNLIRAGDGRIQVTRHLFFPELRGFAPTSAHLFPRGTRGFFDTVPVLGRPKREGETNP